MAQATMRTAPSEHAGVIAVFAASSLVLGKVCFTGEPFIGDDARG